MSQKSSKTKKALWPTVYYGQSAPGPLGPVWVALTQRGLWALSYGKDKVDFEADILDRAPAALVFDHKMVAPALKQVDEFLKGKRRGFDLKVDWSGMTPFQIAVRKAVMSVPYGHTASYADIAAAVGKPLAPRAVGGVQAANPISFIIPCHRIVASDGSLGGYGGFGGLKTKAWLLDLEARNSN